MRLWTRIMPPDRFSRRLALQSAVHALGLGTFNTGSVVFFTVYVGLTPEQIAAGFSAVGFLALAGSLPLGHLADRVGGRRAWASGTLVQAAAFACYPLARGFWAYLLIISMVTLAGLFSDAGQLVYTAAAVPAESRVRIMAFQRTYLNAGFTIGSGLGAAALALNSRTGLLLLVFANVAGMLANGFVVSRFPEVSAVPASAGPRPSPWGVLRDRSYASLALVMIIIINLGNMLFSMIIPLWAVTMTDVPRPVLGGLFALNAVLAVLLQVRATRGAGTSPGAVRLARWAALALAAACPVVALSGAAHRWETVALLAFAVVLVTASELWGSAAQWFFQTDVPPAAQRGVYLGLNRSIGGVLRIASPAALTFLAITTGGWGWWVIAGLFVAVAASVRPVMDWVARTPRNGADRTVEAGG